MKKIAETVKTDKAMTTAKGVISGVTGVSVGLEEGEAVGEGLNEGLGDGEIEGEGLITTGKGGLQTVHGL